MRIHTLFTVAVFLFMVTACYEDKGNYDYKEMNDIEITVEMPDENTSFALGDLVVCTPQLAFALGQENTNLGYEWSFAGKVISHTRNLEWVADTIASNKMLQLAVLDQNTGVTYFGYTDISVTSRYATDGWVVLSEKNGNSSLSFIRHTSGLSAPAEVTKDIYRMINGRPMGTGPVSVYPHWTTRWGGEDNVSWVWVAQKGGESALEVSGSSYQQQTTLVPMFLKQTYPEGFVPAAVMDLQILSLAIGEDGTIYTRVKDANLLFNTGRFIDRPLTSDDKGELKVDGSMIAYGRFDCQGGLLCYDKNSGQYLHISDYVHWDGKPRAGKALPLKVDEGDYKDGDVRLNDMSGYKVHYVGVAYNEDHSYSPMPYMAVIENLTTGKFYLQKFSVDNYDGSMKAMPAKFESQEEMKNLERVIDGSSKNCFTLSRYQNDAPYMFISKDNMLYLYFIDNNTLYPCAQFESVITSMDMNIYSSRVLTVGLENGDVIMLKGIRSADGEPNLARYVINEGNIVQVTDAENEFVLFHEKDFGRVVQVFYKWKEKWNDNFY
jgi:hypothetical protein